MAWYHNLLRRAVGPADRASSSNSDLSREKAAIHRTILRTLGYAIEVHDLERGILEHCALVSMLCRMIGRQVGLSEGDLRTLELAAQLHEVGMFTIPRTLLMGRAPLSAEELERVRGQARISAQIAATTHPPRVAQLIEHQYADYATVAELLPERDTLLAGILRVSDVIAAVARPRPYQSPLPPTDRAQLLVLGAGRQFHPSVVESALRLADQV